MDFIEFSKTIPVSKLLDIFKNYFEEYAIVFNVLQDIEFEKINDIAVDKSSIVYSVRLKNEEDKQRLLETINDLNVEMYNRKFTIHIQIDGDLLYIYINT